MTICIIHTGGTIAMRAGPNGLAPAEGMLEAALDALARAGIVRGNTEVVHPGPLIDSADMRFSDWNKIGAVIAAGQDRYRGFVITHGTDTLAFTAAALAFSLIGLTRPVIVTGAMLPFGAAHSDARTNLGDALLAAARAPAGVWVQFAGRLMHGARVRKAHSCALDAFTARGPIARADEIQIMPAALPTALPAVQPAALRTGDLAHLPVASPEIAVLTMAPNASGRAIAAALAVCDGAVLRVFGAGTIPNDPAITDALMAAQARGALMIAASQAPDGGMALGTYAAGGAMVHAGAIDGGQVTYEAAYAKLAHALAHGGRAVLARDLCGETL